MTSEQDSVNDTNSTHVPLAVICGIFCLLSGLAHFLYSFLAFASVVFVDLLGVGLTLASSALAAVPEEPYEIPYARALAKTIAVTGMAFSIVALVSGCRCFYRRHVSQIDSILCAVICVFLAALHFMNSLTYGGLLYVAVTLVFCCILLADWINANRSNPKSAEPDDARVSPS